MGLSWREAQQAPKDRTKWKSKVAALFPTRDEEVERVSNETNGSLEPELISSFCRVKQMRVFHSLRMAN